MDESARVVLMTVPNRETGERLATALVEGRLAACANVVGGITSIYWWEGEIEREAEALVLLKTRADRVEALVRGAVAIHPYDVPEVVALPVVDGFGPYLEWVAEESKETAEGAGG